MPTKQICPVCGRFDYLVPVDVPGNIAVWRCRVCDSPWICEKTDTGWIFKHELDKDE